MPAPSLATDATGSARTPLRIDVSKGRLETAGHRARFDPAVEDDALIAYLKLVRRLRDVEREPSFVLRRDDVVILAGALREDAVVILDRLGELMGATVTQRRSMITAFLAGALLIAVATGATALAPADGVAPPTSAGGERTDQVASAPADRRAVADDAAVPAVAAGGGVSTDAEASTEDADVGAAGPSTAGPDAAPDAAGAPTAPAVTPPPAGTLPPPGGSTRPGRDDAPGGEVDLPDRGPDGLGPGWPGRWRSGPEIVQPGADIDIPNDEPHDGPEVVQPGADIDIPGDEPDDVPVDVPTPPEHGEHELPPPLPADPSEDVVPPVDPPSDDTRGNGDGNRGIGRGNGGGNGTANEGAGVGPRG